MKSVLPHFRFIGFIVRVKFLTILRSSTYLIYGLKLLKNLFHPKIKSMQINITIQTFKSENELEYSLLRWDKIKNEFMPRFKEMGLVRYTTSRVYSSGDKFQLSHVFEYKDSNASKNCVPIWSDIERKLKEKIESKTTSFRGTLVDRFNFEE